MNDFQCKTDIRTLLQWVVEAQSAHSTWKRESFIDWEFRDGVQWTEAAFQALLKKGINPLTINRIFPILNLIYGHFVRNPKDLTAKGRTKEDHELAQVMSEAFAMVKDQNRGKEHINGAFNDGITAGYGCIEVGKNPDPRCEPVQWQKHPWYSVWWDPYASPWADKETCRYMFTAPWKNLEDLIQVFPEKKSEILEKFANLASEYYVPEIYDVGSAVEDHHKYLSSNHWVNNDRKRIRPVEMWYTRIQKSVFAKMPDSRIIDLDNIKTPGETIQVMQASIELITACVKKTRVATFMSDLLLQDIASPHAHDQYPFVPFVGYLDRFNQPFGVPRQIREQSMEVNKRRSMALSLISNRRVFIEEDAVKDVSKAYSEANRQDGLIVYKKGRRGGVEIQELASMAAPQIDLMNQSEREIREISGSNDEALSAESRLQSGVALDKKQDLSSTVTASLFENAEASQKRLGELTMSMIQNTWTGPKVLRVTDRMTGSEKFMEINRAMYDMNKQTLVIHNNISEGLFDMVVAPAPMTDTMRDKNMELLFSAINKAPAEAIGPLLNMAFEISDVPSKDALLKQLRQSMNMAEPTDNLPLAEKEALEFDREQQKQQQEQLAIQQADEDRRLAIQDTISKIAERNANAEATRRESERSDWEAGHKLGQELLNLNQDKKETTTA